MAGIEPIEFEEEDLATGVSNSSDRKFDTIVGHLEDIVMEDEFQFIQNSFMDKYYHEFEDTEENKFIYTDIFKEYVDLLENHIEQSLVRRMPDFNMESFMRSLKSRENEIGGDIFEMLYSLSDFLSFKQMFLDYKAEKEGRGFDLGGFVITPLGSTHDEDQAMETDQQLPKNPSTQFYNPPSGPPSGDFPHGPPGSF